MKEGEWWDDFIFGVPFGTGHPLQSFCEKQKGFTLLSLTRFFCIKNLYIFEYYYLQALVCLVTKASKSLHQPQVQTNYSFASTKGVSFSLFDLRVLSRHPVTSILFVSRPSYLKLHRGIVVFIIMMKSVLISFGGIVLFFIILFKLTSNTEEQHLVNSKYQSIFDSIRENDLIKKWGVNYKFRMDSADLAKINGKKVSFEKELNKWYKTKAGKLFLKHPEWSVQECKDLVDNRVWIGMTYDMLVCQRGKPNSVNTSNYGSGNQYQCCWHNWNPSCFYMGEDDIVTSYN